MRAVIKSILVLVIVVLCIHNAAMKRELSKWKRDCYDYGYTLVENNADGSVSGIRLKTPAELGLQPALRRTKFFVELESTGEDYDHENGREACASTGTPD